MFAILVFCFGLIVLAASLKGEGISLPLRIIGVLVGLWMIVQPAVIFYTETVAPNFDSTWP